MLRSLPAFALVLALAGTALADEPPLRIELNKLEANGAACRAYLLYENGGEQAFETLKLDLVMFDSSGVIARRLALASGALPAGMSSVRLFDIPDLACEDIGRVLLNDVLECRDAQGERDDCRALIQPTSRTEVPFTH